MQPLQGITVVAVEQAVAAPFATRQLADLGARVIKIERPDGGDFARGYDTTVNGLSSHFVWLNRSKESLTLDLKRPEASDVMARLLQRTDVFVQNLAPGAADHIGAAATDLRKRYPRLIVCNVSGYGSSGPYARKKAYDLLVQSEVGLISITGTEAAASKVGISVADIAAVASSFTCFRRASSRSATTACSPLPMSEPNSKSHASCSQRRWQPCPQTRAPQIRAPRYSGSPGSICSIVRAARSAT